MRAAESKSTSPSSSMWPSSGVSMPAMHLRVTLLPQPEAPSTPVTAPLSVSKAASRRKGPKSLCMSTDSLIPPPPR